MTDIADKKPLNDPDLERAILGFLLAPDYSHRIKMAVLRKLNTDDFYLSRHQVIFDALKTLSEQPRAELDILGLKRVLEEKGDLDRVGGMIYLTTLNDVVNKAVMPSNIDRHIANLKQDSHLRKLQKELIRLGQEFDESRKPDPMVLIHSMQETIQTILTDTPTPVKQFGHAAMQAIDELQNWLDSGSVPVVKTSLDALAELIGGYHDGDLIIVAGRPGMGKTAFALSEAMNAAKHGMPVLFFSLEMAEFSVVVRGLAMQSGISAKRIFRGEFDRSELETMAKRAVESINMPLYFDTTANIGVDELVARIGNSVIEQGIRMVFIDYTRFIRSTLDPRENYRFHVDDIVTRLKQAAKQYQIPIVLIHQLSRAVEQRADKRPLMSDLAESGSLEQHADVILFLFRPEVYDQDAPHGFMEVIVGKQRNGPTGIAIMAFDKETMTIRPADPKDLEMYKRIMFPMMALGAEGNADDF